jgi:hypothetical protein
MFKLLTIEESLNFLALSKSMIEVMQRNGVTISWLTVDVIKLSVLFFSLRRALFLI